jgi:hypothetical protein
MIGWTQTFSVLQKSVCYSEAMFLELDHVWKTNNFRTRVIQVSLSEKQGLRAPFPSGIFERSGLSGFFQIPIGEGLILIFSGKHTCARAGVGTM